PPRAALRASGTSRPARGGTGPGTAARKSRHGRAAGGVPADCETCPNGARGRRTWFRPSQTTTSRRRRHRTVSARKTYNGTSYGLFPTPARGRTPFRSPGRVPHGVGGLKGGTPAAAQPLGERYYRRLVAWPAKSPSPPAADEEDVVQNAFHSFFRAVAEGR